jgi:DNA-directed RNA polymerase specialized sigma24 family protein
MSKNPWPATSGVVTPTARAPSPAAAVAPAPDDVVALGEALSRLERHDPAAAALAKLRYFAGLSRQEAAAAPGLSRGAADRLLALARTWLVRQLSAQD